MTLYDMWWKLVLLASCSYFVGNINFALILSRFQKKDIREQGSGNPGTMNMLRNFGLKLGILTLVLDVVKGFVPTMIGFLVFDGKMSESNFNWGILTQYIAGLSTVIGHIFPVTMKFKGGKGVATTIGLFMFVQPLVTVAMFVVIFLYIYRYEFGSVGSLIIVTFMSIFEIVLYYIEYGSSYYPELAALFIMIFFLCFLSYFAHRENIKRLLLGIENRTPLRQMIEKYRAHAQKKQIKKQLKLQLKEEKKKDQEDKEE